MFKERAFQLRVASTLVLVPLVLVAIFYANTQFLAGLSLVLVALAGWEWTALIPLKTLWTRLLFLFLLLMIAGLGHGLVLGWLSFTSWFILFLAVVYFPRSQSLWGFPLVVFGFGLFFLPLMLQSLWAIYTLKQGPSLLIYVFCLVWAIDVGAYLVGKQWGKHRLIPLVSPGKTIEGAMGGLFSGLLVTMIGFYCFDVHSWVYWLMVALLTLCSAILGDLFISMLKRREHLKDTGALIPGHGGFLDRIDSLMAALPIFYGSMHYFFGS